MTVTWLDPTRADDASWQAAARRGLRLVESAGGALPGDDGEAGDDGDFGFEPRNPPLTLVPARRHGAAGRRRSSPGVRRRRTLLAVMGLLLIALALPLSGTGGYSHPAGSALAENRGPVVYTVQPGDSLWSIAERLDPTADPRPLVARLASQTGSESVRPGERIVLP
ncbi:MAG: LysM domain-containing protein [Acidimicrobiales bacterium]